MFKNSFSSKFIIPDEQNYKKKRVIRLLFLLFFLLFLFPILSTSWLNDADDDGIVDFIECKSENWTCVDSDWDWVADYRDIDSDNDWYLDADERWRLYWWSTYGLLKDSDGDKIPNYLDRDDDNDWVFSWFEFIWDTDGDWTVDYLDSDDDDDWVPTFLENTDWDLNWFDNDNDVDWIPDFLDSDDDNDWVLWKYEQWDTDWDWIPDYLDPDDDNDWKLTINEDTNGDWSPRNDDSDWDGIPNYLDSADTINNKIDTDKDWIKDFEECIWWFPCIDSDNDWIPNNEDTDSDNDWLLDSEEGLENTDKDSLPNFLDPDDDNDWINTREEVVSSENEHWSWETSNNSRRNWINKWSNPRSSWSSSVKDTDWDWILDHLDSDNSDSTNTDSDWDGIPDTIECPDPSSCADSDWDWTSDVFDSDSDNNWIPDGQEWNWDTDWDWLPDYVDSNNTVDNFIDSDGDWILDYIECPNINFCPDTDWDWVPDYLDSDENTPDTWSTWWGSWTTSGSSGWGWDTWPHRCPHPFGWYPLDHNLSITAYENSQVVYPAECLSEDRLCQYWTLEWTYEFEWCIQTWASCFWPDWFETPHWEKWMYYKYKTVIWDPTDGNDECPKEWRDCIDWNWYLNGTKKWFSFIHKICTVIASEVAD